MKAGQVIACRARECQSLVPMGTLMCRKHWAFVPSGLRASLRGNRDLGISDLVPSSQAWAALASAAIEAVGDAENIKASLKRGLGARARRPIPYQLPLPL